ncbi:hypothetical protein M569_14425 [Genlisea aurea]|uniref:Ubiquitin-like protease family profile domain-containing protein n=1 Tax=Genlisea aurea TaxID=192259 RepID=S8DC84_9LAMI|nr:hypothetical protein M569_14425 [Genlisea aurea]
MQIRNRLQNRRHVLALILACDDEGLSYKRIKRCKESELATEPNAIVLNPSGECNDDDDKEPTTELKACDEEGLSNERVKRCKESELATEPNTVVSNPPSGGDTHDDHDVNDSSESLPETVVDVAAVEKVSYRPLSAYGMLSDAEFDDALDIVRSEISEERSEAFAFVHSLYFGAWCRKKKSETIMKRILQLDIFIRKKYVFIPVAASSHWWLIILCNPSMKQKRCAILLDSLGSGNAEFNEASVRRFTNALFASSNPSEPAAAYRRMPIYKQIVGVPKQQGGTECGIYVLYYIYLFARSAPDQFELRDYPYFVLK